MEKERIEYKQNFLRTEIIDQGYNPEEFSDYLSSEKGENGLNLDNWSFTQLQEIVRNFKLQYSNSSFKNQNYEQKKYYDQENIPEINSGKDIKQKMNNKKIINKAENILMNNSDIQLKKAENILETFKKIENNNDKIKKQTNNKIQIQKDITEEKKINNKETLKENTNFETTKENKNEEINIENQNEEKKEEKKEENKEEKKEEKKEENKEEKKEENNEKKKEEITTESKIQENCVEIEKEDIPIEQSKNYISCKKQERNAFTEMTDLKIIITTPEYIKGSLFSFSYYQYTLLIPRLNSECIRRTSDFEWLQKKLILLFPATFFPPLPESSFFDKNTLDNVYRKVRELNYYINTISQNILVRSSKFFQDFITLPLSEFQRKKKYYDSINSPISMQNFTTMEGIIDVTVDDQKDSVCCNFISDIKNKNILYNNLDNALRNLILEFDIMSTRINDVAISFEKLSNSYHFTVKGDKINKILMKFSESFSNWGKNYLTQQIFFDEEIREVFKFMSKDLINLNSLNEEFSCARINYMESKKLYYSKDQEVAKKAEKDFENNQICFGFILNRFYDEFSRVNIEHSNKMKNLQIYLQERKDSVFSDYLGLSKLMNME